MDIFDLGNPLTNRGDTESSNTAPNSIGSVSYDFSVLQGNPARLPSLKIDHLTFTFFLRPEHHARFRWLFKRFWASRLYMLDRLHFKTISVPRNGFLERIVLFLGDEASSFCFGGNQGYVQLEARGTACKYLFPRDWLVIYRIARLMGARITRCDIAADFFNGEVSVRKFERACKRNLGSVWHVRGPEPKHYAIDKGSGRTYYVGSEASPKRVRVYEKGYQLLGRLGAQKAEIDAWVRVELQLRRAKGALSIDHEILLSDTWAPTLASLGPWFEKIMNRYFPILSGFLPIGYERPDKPTSFEIGLRRQILHVRYTYGRFLQWARDQFGDSVVLDMLCRQNGEWRFVESHPDWRDCPEIQRLLQGLSNPNHNLRSAYFRYWIRDREKNAP